MSSFWIILKLQWTIKISSPLFSIFSLAAILVGSRDHRTQFWKGAIQGPFHQSFVAIGPVVSEEKIKMWNVDGRATDDWRKVMTSLKARWAKNMIHCILQKRIILLIITDRYILYGLNVFGQNLVNDHIYNWCTLEKFYNFFL